MARARRNVEGAGRGRKKGPFVRLPPKEEVAPRPGEGGAPHDSATAVAARALRSGVLPRTGHRPEAIPHEGETIRVGDPDDDALANEYVGEDTPGGSTSTPDQNDVDEIGRAYGLQEEDTGALRSSSEVLARRDRRRQELKAPGRPES